MKKIVLTTLACSVSFYAGYCVADNDETTKQVTRQVTRQISNSIARRIGETSEGDAAVGSDFNAWGNPQYTDLAFRGSSTSIYSLTFGGDKKFNNLFLGGSMSYNRSETQMQGLSGFYANAWSVSPYMAYKFNEHVFFSGILGYAGSSDDNSSLGSTTFLSDISLNGLTNVYGFGLTGKVGYRGIHSDITGIPAGAGNAFFSQTAYLGGEVSKKLGNFRPYFASTWEHIAPDVNAIKDSDLVFSTLGVDYSVHKATTVGLYYTRELTRGDDSQNHMIYNAAGANLKVKF